MYLKLALEYINFSLVKTIYQAKETVAKLCEGYQYIMEEKKKQNYIQRLQREFEQDTGKHWSDSSFRYWLMFKIHNDLNDGMLCTKVEDVPKNGRKYITDIKYS